MPIFYSLMAKDSDLFECDRSSRRFLDQLRRCTGLIPVNVLATINNRLIIDEPAHEEWEAEFLNENVRRRLHRHRVRHSAPSVVFTRAGALLNLKLLLSLQPTGSEYRSTALGAISTHANDYVESVDVSHLASGSLSLIAEFAPTWELQNFRPPARLLARTYYLYQLAQNSAKLTTLFQKPLGEVRIAGLAFDQYFALLFGIYTTVRTNILATPYPTSILDAEYVAHSAGLSADDFETFVSAKSLSFNNARDLFSFDGTSHDLLSCVEDVVWCGDLRRFRERPLFRCPDGRFLVLDLQYLFESASAGLSWSLMHHLDDASQRLRFLDTWGDLFEQYVCDLLGHYYPEQASQLRRNYEPDGQIDAALAIGERAVVFEVKAGFIAEEAKASRDMAQVDAALRKKYVTDSKKGKDRPVGVRQLAASAKAVLAGRVQGLEDCRRVTPVLIAEDPMLQTPGTNIYLDSIFTDHATDDRIDPLLVMTVDELEELLPHLRAGDLTWSDLVDARFEGERIASVPVHTTLIDLAVNRSFPRRPETFLASVSASLQEIVRDAYRRSETNG